MYGVLVVRVCYVTTLRVSCKMHPTRVKKKEGKANFDRNASSNPREIQLRLFSAQVLQIRPVKENSKQKNNE